MNTTAIPYLRSLLQSALALAILLSVTASAFAQATAFTYQGRLTDSGNPATGVFDMQFKLFDTPDTGTGTQLGVVENPSVQITNGVFSVQLDFGAVFDGAARFLEICLRPAGSTDPYTVLAPRQPISSTPYALRSAASATADGLSAACANCVTNTQIQSVDGAQVTGSIAGSQITGSIPVESVPTGSGSYIQNAVAALRSGRTAVTQDAGFNITGDGIIGGNVGIGANPPTSKLDVRGNLTLDAGASPTLYTSTATTEQNRSLNLINSFAFPSAAGLKAGGILVADSYSFANPGKNDLIVKGNVGIGAQNPTTKLTVSSNFYGISHTDGSVNLSTFLNSSGGWLGTRTNHSLHFYANDSSPLMTITPQGNVGIGIPSPGLKLHVVGTGVIESLVQSTNERAILSLDSTLNGQRRVWTMESGVFGTPGLFAIFDRTAGRIGLQIDTTGMVAVKVLQIQGGGDFSENFDVSDAKGTKAGTVSKEIERGLLVSIDSQNPGKLVVSRRAYDRSVAGIISGAGGISPGLVMGQQGSIADGKHPVALSGRVWAYCDARGNPIKPGDLLTTSATPGHAMKVRDYRKAQGAIIGKAMTALKRGRGLVLVLVSLQ